MIITHNMMAMNAMRQYNIVGGAKQKNTEKLSSGYKINRAADDAAGLAISEKMRRQIRGLSQGSRNTQDGISWLQIGDGAMSEIDEMVHRIEELAVKAANGTNTDVDRGYIDTEIQQLKAQINSIARTTTFNEISIFDNDFVEMNIDGTPSDLTAFNASYENGQVSWGGIVINGNRVTWDTIDANMVTLNDNGEQIFVGGDYKYNDDGTTLSIHVEDGDRPPQIKRTLNLAGTSSGLSIDGNDFDWSKIVDEDGKLLSTDNYHGGVWSVDFKGATVSFLVPEESADSYEALTGAIAQADGADVTYIWTTEYIGATNEKAANISNLNNKSRLTNATVAQAKAELDSGDYFLTLRASKEDGVWLEDNNGSKVSGSNKSWADLGITSWDSGKDISSSKSYKYDVIVDGEPFSFSFELSDTTSVDSVVQALDGVTFSAAGNGSAYSQTATVTTAGNITGSSVSSSSVNLSLAKELQLSRNFDVKNAEIQITSEVSDTSKNTATNQVKTDVSNYLSFIENLAVAATINGKDTYDLNDSGLTSLLGGNITTSGYFSGTVMLTADMNNCEGSRAGKVGSTYPAAYIDFDSLTESNIGSLLGTGFNSTCKTCNNHYSVVFSSGIDNGSTVDGIKYTYGKQGSYDYMLQIDIDSLNEKVASRAAGETVGETIANALLTVLDKVYDFHFTQYATDGSTLYIYDNRSQNYAAVDATFDTKPFGSDGKDTFNLEYEGYDGKTTTVRYNYDYSDVADSLKVDMKNATAEKLTDGSTLYTKNSNGSYSEYLGDVADAVDNGVQLYYLDKYYKNSDGNTVSRSELISEYADNAVSEMTTSTTVKLVAKDYSYLLWNGDENSNVAIKPNYESNLVMTERDNGIYIKHSSNEGDRTYICRFSMTTAAMGLYNAGCVTVDQAESTIGYTKTALSYVASKRSLYGALQNRLEHTYNNNMNKEENMTASESRIRDTDMAKSMVKEANYNILMQVSQSMIANANSTADGVLRLLGQ